MSQLHEKREKNLVDRVQDAAKSPTAPHAIKNYMVPYVSGAKVEEP